MFHFFKTNHKKLIKISFFSFILLISTGALVPAFGQFIPFIPYPQLYLPPVVQPFLPNINSVSQFNLFNPYYINYSPLNIYRNYTPLSRAPLYPQASVAGGLVPFSSPFTNPFLPTYNIASLYYAAAVVPVDVSGSWAGQWSSTFLTAGIITGELSITLAQSGVDVTGTAVFLLNKVLKFGAYVVGTVAGDVLTLTSTVVTSPIGTMAFDVKFIATVSNVSMEGTYEVINLTTGLIAEQGTFVATKI